MQTPILLTSLALTALIGVASTGNSQEHAEVITDPAADALASRVEHSFQLNGGLELFGLTAPYETEALGTIDLVDPTGDEVALAHIEAVDTLRELAAEAGQVDVLSLPEPITIRGIRVNGNRPVLSGGTNTVLFATDWPYSPPGADWYIFEGFEVTGGSSQVNFVAPRRLMHPGIYGFEQLRVKLEPES